VLRTYSPRAQPGAQVLEGAPPQLTQVGPFVLRRTTAKYNIAFDHAARRVDWHWLQFDELVTADSCAECTLNATARACCTQRSRALAGVLPARALTRRAGTRQIYGPNVMYAGLMQRTGWTEAPLLLAFVPVRTRTGCASSPAR
jgi:hypothetical protein